MSRPLHHPIDSEADATAKPGLNAFGRRFMELLGRTVDEAGEAGVSRVQIAEALGVSPHTVESWLKPSRASLIPVDRCFELACREDILPDAIRDRFWAAVGAEAGYINIPELRVTEGNVAPLPHLAAIAAALGRLAERVRAATEADSPHGGRVSSEEAGAMLEPLRSLEHEVAELRVCLESLLRHKRTGN